MALGRPEEALPILEIAVRIHADDYVLLSALCDCYDMSHRPEDLRRSLVRIRELLVKAIDREPDDVRARGILGIALAQSGASDAALVQIERAIAAAPGDGRVRYNAACAFAHMGRRERAIAELREVARNGSGVCCGRAGCSSHGWRPRSASKTGWSRSATGATCCRTAPSASWSTRRSYSSACMHYAPLCVIR